MSAQRNSWSPYTMGTASGAGDGSVPQPQLDSGPGLNLLAIHSPSPGDWQIYKKSS